jgi:hypothetical protein
MIPRGIRNNNPLNLEYGPFTIAQGATGSDGRFAVFPDMPTGIAALAKQLMIYQDQHGLDTISGIVNRWAPSSENNTAAYISFVCSVTGLQPDDHLNMHDTNTLFWMITGMGEEECGATAFSAGVSDSDIDTGIAKALGVA